MKYRHLLVPTDGSLVSARAERTAISVARQFGARITAMHVLAPYSPTALGEIHGLGPAPLTPDEYKRASEKRGKALLARVAARARRAGIRLDRVMVTDYDPAEALVRAARDHDCDLIVMGSSNRVGIQRIFLGSVASEVVNGTRVAALICH